MLARVCVAQNWTPAVRLWAQLSNGTRSGLAKEVHGHEPDTAKD